MDDAKGLTEFAVIPGGEPINCMMTDSEFAYVVSGGCLWKVTRDGDLTVVTGLHG